MNLFAFFLRESWILGIFLGIFLGISQALCGTACPTSASTAASSSVESQMTMGLCDPSSRLSPAPSLSLRLSLPRSHSLSRSLSRSLSLSGIRMHRSVDFGVLLCVSCPPENTPNFRFVAPNAICACGPWRRVAGSALRCSPCASSPGLCCNVCETCGGIFVPIASDCCWCLSASWRFFSISAVRSLCKSCACARIYIYMADLWIGGVWRQGETWSWSRKEP